MAYTWYENIFLVNYSGWIASSQVKQHKKTEEEIILVKEKESRKTWVSSNAKDGLKYNVGWPAGDRV